MSGAAELEARITSYLSLGGLFNPEMANHDAVRDLLIDCRAELATFRSDNERLGRERDAILKRAQTAEQWLREANFLVREHKSACADAISQAQAAEAERDTLLAQVEKMRGAMREQRLKPGVRAVIACVQHRATEMGDPKCKAWLNSLAFHLGLQLKRDHIDLSEAIDGSLTDAALTKEPS